MKAQILQVAKVTTGKGGCILSLLHSLDPRPKLQVLSSDVALPNQELRDAGLLRPGSVTMANRLAASLILYGLDILQPEEKAALITCSSSSTFSVSYAFENDGLSSDWRLVDPFNLPNSIPTALATNVARLAPCFTSAFAMGGTAIQVERALQYAIVMLHRGRVDECWVVAAEQSSKVQSEAAKYLGMVYSFHDSASFIRLTRCSPDNQCHYYLDLASISTSKEGEEPVMRDDIKGPNATQRVFTTMIDYIRSHSNGLSDHRSLVLPSGLILQMSDRK